MWTRGVGQSSQTMDRFTVYKTYTIYENSMGHYYTLRVTEQKELDRDE
jgi:hypothetical protein